MMRSLKALTSAAFAATLCVAAANAADKPPGYDDYDKDHFGIFFDSKYEKKCAFDHIWGKEVSIDPKFIKIGYKLYRKVEAECKIPYYSYKSQHFDDFKCIYVDKSKYGSEDVIRARESSFEYYAKWPYAKLKCLFFQKVRHPYPPPYPPPHPYPPPKY